MPDEQNLSNHAKWDPPFHFFLAPMASAFLIYCGVHLYRHPEKQAVLLLAAAITALVAVFKMRLYSLKVQDRIIRLEERLRLATVLPENLRSRIGELSTDQLIALRFASDAEVPALTKRALDEKLSRKEIKKAIVSWRADYFRV
ncbi:MAG: hypothetical protein JWO13_1264 [Acidobacteriales bacterium]|nr:hypothetical protein [Terriglobales bacterium]